MVVAHSIICAFTQIPLYLDLDFGLRIRIHLHTVVYPETDIISGFLEVILI